MHGDFGGEELVGRRSGDGNFISFREAVKMFATKEELAGLRTGIESLVVQVGALVPRAEHEVRWQIEEQFRQETRRDLEEIKRQRVPERVTTNIFSTIALVVSGLSVAAAIIIAVVRH